MTKDGLRKLEKELAQLKARRPSVAERIKAARDFGDIAENSEYIEAKNEQGQVEGRIMDLEAMIRNAVLIDRKGRQKGVVSVGGTVTVKMSDGKKIDYTIVGPAEADPLAGRISNESPLGRALIGHKVGETVEWIGPSGSSKVKILEVH